MKIIKDIMVTKVFTANENETLSEVAIKMLENNVGCLPVLNDEGKLVGFLSETDFAGKEKLIPFSRNHAPQLFGKWLNEGGIEEMYKNAKTMKVSEIMSTPPISISEDETIVDLIEKIMKYNIHRIPVLKDDELVGIVSRRDLLKLLFIK